MKREHYDKKAVLKFLIYSMAGIFVFFGRIPVGGTWSILIDHMIAWLREICSRFYGQIIFLISGYAVLRRVIKKQTGRSAADRFLFFQSAAGFLLSSMMLLHTGPEALQKAGGTAVQATGNILCAIFLSSVFVPLLLEYGLVDAAGVIFRPLMRKLFLTPGSSAVIGVSAFLGNYSMGHVVSRQMYDEGKFTEKEMVIVATGFSTCSIGLMLNLAHYLDLMEYWTAYVVCILIVTFIVTAVVSRLFPIRNKRGIYKEGTKPSSREDEEVPLLRGAWNAGVYRASEASGLTEQVKNILVRIFPVICEITGTSMFIITCGDMAASRTNLFFWLGILFCPFLRIAGVAAAELPHVQQAIGACLMEPVLSGVVCSQETLSLHSRWIVGIVPYTAIIFFAGSVPSLLSAKVHCRIWELLLLWAERVVLSILLAGVAGWILFG